MKFGHKPMIGVPSLRNVQKAKGLPWGLQCHEKLKLAWAKYRANPLTKTRAQIILDEWINANVIERDKTGKEKARAVERRVRDGHERDLVILFWHDYKTGYMRHWDSRAKEYTINFFEYEPYLPAPKEAIALVHDEFDTEATEPKEGTMQKQQTLHQAIRAKAEAIAPGIGDKLVVCSMPKYEAKPEPPEAEPEPEQYIVVEAWPSGDVGRVTKGAGAMAWDLDDAKAVMASERSMGTIADLYVAPKGAWAWGDGKEQHLAKVKASAVASSPCTEPPQSLPEPEASIEPQPQPIAPAKRPRAKRSPKRDRHILVSKHYQEPELIVTTNGARAMEFSFSVSA